MGLFDDLVSGAVSKMLEDTDSRTLASVLPQLLAKTDLGSVGGLLALLQQAGLDRQVASWLGSGSNLPLTADQLRGAIGDPSLSGLAGQTGLSLDTLFELLAQRLPGAVDRMSPNGTLEDPGTPDADRLARDAGLDDIQT